jgi:hypothetical protein
MKTTFHGWGRVYGESLKGKPMDQRWAEAMSRASILVAELPSTSTTKAKMMDSFLAGVTEAFLNDAVL